MVPFQCCSSTFGSGKTIAKYAKGSAGFQSAAMLWHCFHNKSFQQSVISCSCLPSTGDWSVKLEKIEVWVWCSFSLQHKWCKESICIICALWILHDFML